MVALANGATVNVTRNGLLYRCSHISGPGHNFVGLDLSPGDDVEVHAAKIDDGPSNISADDVRTAVLGALARFNEARGTTLRISKIEYVPSDTPGQGVYDYMTTAILEAALEDGLGDGTE